MNTIHDNISTKLLNNKKNYNLLPWSEKYRPTTISGILYHDKIVKCITNYMSTGKLPHLLFYGQPGSGKCLGYNTPVIMYNGQIKMVQDINIGEKLLGDNSTPRTVLNTTTGFDTMYKIKQTVGNDYIVNSSHIISLKLSKIFFIEDLTIYWFINHKTQNKIFNSIEELNVFAHNLLSNKNINKIFDVCDIPIQEYINKDNIWKKLYKGYKSNLVDCWNEKNVLIDPFELGLCYSNKKCNSVNLLNNLYKYNLISSDNNLKFQYIPDDYKFTSVKNRIKLLQGYLLLFCDKNFYNSNNCIFTESITNKTFFDDLIFIFRSLGINPNIKFNSSNIEVNISSDIVKLLYNYDNIKNINFLKYKNELLCDIDIEQINYNTYYGFELDGNKRFVLGDFTITHNTSLILAIAKHYYKDDFDNMTMVLNASEERGIETVRNRIKQFVICKGINTDPSVPTFKLIILDEIDAMTDDAQAILRKVIEKYVSNVRFCFICNYLQKINPAIQSRCVLFKFNPISQNSMYQYVENICEIEQMRITQKAIKLIIKFSKGDMRKLLNILQSLYMYNDMDIVLKQIKNETDETVISILKKSLVINEKLVSENLSCPSHKNIINILNCVQTKNLNESFTFIKKIVDTKSISLSELIDYIFDFTMDYFINDNTTYIKFEKNKVIEIIKKLSIINENITCCSRENIQLLALVAIFYI
jgi:replication factor C subunit 3/5